MHDPVLNRKMFRHAAQIKHNRIPKYQTGTPPGGVTPPWYTTGAGLKGAWQAGPGKHLWDFNKGRMYNTAMLAAPWKKGQLAWGVGKAAIRPAMKLAQKAYGKVAAPASKYIGKPYTKHISKPLSKHMMKYPKTYGYTKAGIGGAFTGASLWGAGKAAHEGKWGTAAMQASLIPFGGGMTAKGIQLASKGWKGKQTFLRSGNVKKWARKQGWTLPAILGGAGTAWWRGEGEAGELANDELNLIGNIAVQIAEDDPKATEVTESHWNEAVKTYEENLAGEEGIADRDNPNEMNILNNHYDEMLAEEINPPGSPDGDEAAILAAQQEKNKITQADGLKNKFDNTQSSETKAKFLEFRKAISELTGAQGPDRDLLMMKLASGLMTNKTSEKGLRGFLDVAGQSTGPVVDTAIALNQSQKKFDNDLAVAFLKAEAEKAAAAEGGGYAMAGAQKRFIVNDPNAPFGFRVFMGQYNTETGQIFEDLGNQQYRLATGEPQEINVSTPTLQKNRSAMAAAAAAHDMAGWVQTYMDDNLKGAPGNIKLKLADWLSLSNTMNSQSNKYTQGLGTGEFVNDIIFAPDNLSTEKVEIKDWKGKVIRETTVGEQLKDEYYKDQARIKVDMAKHAEKQGWDVNEEQLAQLTKAALIENRLKYIVANANKTEDRLTRWDIENAESNTRVLPFFNFSTGFTARTVNAKMAAIQAEMQGSFSRAATKYQQAGGTNNYILTFKNMPYIQQYLFDMEASNLQEQEVIQTLETIPVPGA